MKNTFNGWSDVLDLNLDTVVDLVLTNGTSQTIKSDNWLISTMGDESKSLSVLDFGSGVGRNIFDFSNRLPNWKFYGYDNPNMIEKSNEYSIIRFKRSIKDYSNVQFISNWDILKTMRFDCIYSTLVFQHIFEKDLNIYLQDIKKMTNKLIVSGRRFNDDFIDGQHKNTWQIMENNGYYPSDVIGLNYSVDGNPHDHFTCVYQI